MLTETEWFADNQANWNDRARTHMSGNYYGANELIANPESISAELAQDIHRFGNLNGKSVIHLQCHLGTDTIGFARRGAKRVVGLDLSDTSLEFAKDIAAKSGVTVEFVHSNVYNARENVEGHFDLVYTSLGVLCWLPDIEKWAETIVSLMAPGGCFFIRDDHPMFMTIGDDVSNGLKIEQPYFQLDQPLTWEDETSYILGNNAPKIKAKRNHQWNHSIGEIITALIRAGLTIDSVEETPYSAWCPWPELMVKEGHVYRLKDAPERLPLQFVICAHK